MLPKDILGFSQFFKALCNQKVYVKESLAEAICSKNSSEGQIDLTGITRWLFNSFGILQEFQSRLLLCQISFFNFAVLILSFGIGF